MNKTLLRCIVIVLVTLIFLYAFSSSHLSNNIDNISYVIALGVDLAEDKNNLKVTFEFMDVSSFSTQSSSENTSPILDSVTSTSISSAINLMNAYLGKKINLAHCKVIIFSGDLASKGISNEITELMNEIQVRPTTNIIISRDNTKDYIEHSTSSLERVLTKYYDIFPNSSEYTGYTSNVTIGKFYNDFMNEDSGNIAILGGVNEASVAASKESSGGGNSSGQNFSGKDSSSQNSSSESSSEGSSSSESASEAVSADSTKHQISPSKIIAGNSSIVGERGTENLGLAIFKGDKYVGDLTTLETLCHSLITDEVESFLLTIDDSNIYEKYIDLSLSQTDISSISVDTSGDVPTININISLKGRILNVKDGLNSANGIDLDKLSNSASEYLKATILNYLNKTSSEFKCDIDGFYKYAKHKLLTTSEWEKYDWASKYPNAKFNVSIDVDVYFSLLTSGK